MVKLSSGKELELRDITRKEAIKFKMASALGYNGYDVFYDCALSASGMLPSEFEEKFTDEEIIEIAGLVFEKMNLSETQKKS